jgi:hypothetical protein
MVVFEPTSEGGYLARWTGGWIKAIEWLPELGESVLVSYLQKGARVVSCAARYAKGDGTAYWGEWDSQEIFIIDNVTHWQPLPEPPKD